MQKYDDLKSFCSSFERIYIYGAGLVAEDVATELEAMGCEYEAFIVSDGQKKNSQLFCHKILHFSEVDLSKNSIGIILGLNKKNQETVLSFLKNNGCESVYPFVHEDVVIKQIQDISCIDRCNLVEKYYKNGNFIGILLCDHKIEAQHTYRYRAYNISQLMNPFKSKWKFVYFFLDELNVLEDLVIYLNSITLLRLQWTFELGTFIHKAKANNVKLFYDIDDLEFDINYLPIFMETLNFPKDEKSYQRCFSTAAREVLLCNEADGFTSTNYFLAQKLIDTFHKKCTVIPNFLNSEQILISKKCNLEKNSNEFIIGYFSGTRSHEKDFQECSREIAALMKEYENIILQIVGYMDLPEELNPYIEIGRIKRTPFVDFRSLQKLMAEVDLNIAPLVINDFTNCKSELKFFEAAMVKKITCASPTYTFKQCIISGVNGFLCEKGQWYHTIKSIYLKTVNVKRIEENAYYYTIENYMGMKIINKIENAYNELCCKFD